MWLCYEDDDDDAIGCVIAEQEEVLPIFAVFFEEDYTNETGGAFRRKETRRILNNSKNKRAGEGRKCEEALFWAAIPSVTEWWWIMKHKCVMEVVPIQKEFWFAMRCVWRLRRTNQWIMMWWMLVDDVLWKIQQYAAIDWSWIRVLWIFRLKMWIIILIFYKMISIFETNFKSQSVDNCIRRIFHKRLKDKWSKT